MDLNFKMGCAELTDCMGKEEKACFIIVLWLGCRRKKNCISINIFLVMVINGINTYLGSYLRHIGICSGGHMY